MFKLGIILLSIGFAVTTLLPGMIDIGLLPIFAGVGLMLSDEG